MGRFTLEQACESLKEGKVSGGFRCFKYYTRNYIQPGAVVDKEGFDKHVGLLLRYIKKTLKDIEKNTGRAVNKFCIGKTFATKSKRAQVVDPKKSSTVCLDGMGSRWSDTYGKKGYDLMVAVQCFVLDDVPETLKAYDIDQQQLVLIYESALEHELDNDSRRARKKHAYLSDKTSNGDRGGGGRMARRGSHAAYLLYIAVGLEPYEEEEEEEEDEDEGSETLIVDDGSEGSEAAAAAAVVADDDDSDEE